MNEVWFAENFVSYPLKTVWCVFFFFFNSATNTKSVVFLFCFIFIIQLQPLKQAMKTLRMSQTFFSVQKVLSLRSAYSFLCGLCS